MKRANPFYVLILPVSTAFVVTVLAYLIGPFLQQKAAADPKAVGPGSRAMAAWFDRNGTTALGVEFAAMTALAVAAMATDRHFSGSKAKQTTE